MLHGIKKKMENTGFIEMQKLKNQNLQICMKRLVIFHLIFILKILNQWLTMSEKNIQSKNIVLKIQKTIKKNHFLN